MAKKRRISPAERRHQDYLRRKGLKVGAVYEARLQRLRAHEVKRVLEVCADTTDNVLYWPSLIETHLDETGYLPKWWDGVYQDCGLPMCESTARDLNKAKAATDKTLWSDTLKRYADNRAGSNIVIVSGTLRDSLIDIIRDLMKEEPALGIEKLTKRIFSKYKELAKWQVRRIAQTESMVAMADAAHVAAETLDVAFTKQWCISGLGNTRDSHEVMDGIEVDQDDPFVLAGGQLLYPHDGSLGANASEIINCACSCIRRPKSSSSKPVTEKPPTAQPVEPAAPAAETFATITETAPVEDAVQEARIQDIMKEMDQALPEAIRRAIAENDLELEKKLGIKKGAPMSVEKADQQSANPNFMKDRAYQINCVTCSDTFVMRMRGFNVTAKGNTAGSLVREVSEGENTWKVWRNADGTAVKPTSLKDWMAKKKVQEMTSELYQEFYEEVCKEQGTYITLVRWNNGGGHATVVMRKADGTLIRIEPQSYFEFLGTERPMDTITKWCHKDPWDDCGILRVDDKILNPKYAGLFSTQ